MENLPAPRYLSPIEVLAGMLETLGDERPDLVAAYVDITANSPMRWSLLELAQVCAVDLDGLTGVICTLSKELHTLEHRKRWRDPRHVLEDEPNLGGLLTLCRVRRRRAKSQTRERRLRVVERKLEAAYENHRRKRWIIEFLGIDG